MKKGILIVIGLIGLATGACKKNDNGKTATTAQLLASATWKYDTVMLDLNKDGVADSPVPDGFIESCDLDNTITFNSDMSGVTNEGATKCDEGLPQTTPFTWALNNNNTTLTITGNSQSEFDGDMTIKQITNTTLVLMKNVNITDPLPLSANVIITLKK